MLASLLSVAIAAAACNAGGPNDAATPSSSEVAGFLKTPAKDRQLPEGVYAIGWDGVGEPRAVVEEPLPDGYEIETVTEGLTTPVGLAFLPDGRILVGEQQTGRIRLIKDGELRDTAFAVAPDVVQGNLELGLLGIAVDPEFEENGFVYAFYVEADSDGDPARAVLVRYRERLGVGSNATEIAEFPATATDKHNGGGLEFGPDGKLYVTIGDTDRKEQAADPARLAGKILRLNTDGSAPADNPLANDPDADPRVFAYGFRNLFGLAFHPDLPPGLLIAPDNAVSEFDELNIVRPGANYGWPEVTGFGRQEGIEGPVWAYYNSVAPAGLEVYTGDELREFRGDLFFCGYNLGGALHRVRFSDDFARVVSDGVVATGCSTSIAQGTDQFLYFLEYNRREPDEGVLRRIASGD